MSRIKIRQATLLDVPALVALNRLVHELHAATAPEMFRQDPPDQVVADGFSAAMGNPSSFWLLAEDDGAVGFLNAEFRDRAETWCMVAHQACYIGTIVVAPDCRRRGIARALLAELKHEADRRAVKRIELDVWTFNDEARKAFENLGFRPVMERMALSTEEPT